VSALLSKHANSVPSRSRRSLPSTAATTALLAVRDGIESAVQYLVSLLRTSNRLRAL